MQVKEFLYCVVEQSTKKARHVKQVVGFAKSINVNSSIAAKLWALREGLVLCIEHEAHVVEIELDAFATISIVASNVNTNGDLSSLVDDCKELLLQLPQVKLSHYFREANFYTDALAKLGSASSDVSSILVTPPPAITLHLSSDMMGLYHRILCTNIVDVGVS
nr:putative ribonuclease h protein [Quercus suber]